MKRTTWFPYSVKPARPGWYEIEAYWFHLKTRAYFDQYWFLPKLQIAITFPFKWRGLVKDPKAKK